MPPIGSPWSRWEATMSRQGRRGSVKKDPGGHGWYFVVDTAPEGAPRRQTRQRGFRTRGEAQAALTKKLAEVQQGRYVARDPITVGEYLTDWLDRREKAQQLRGTTLKSYRDCIRLHVEPSIGSVRLQALTSRRLDHLYGEMLTDGRRAKTRPADRSMSPSSVRRVHAMLRKAFNDAVAQGVINQNPALRTTGLPGPVRRSAGELPPHWELDELAAFLDRSHDHPMYALFWLASATGMRRGELCGLLWSDLDLDGGTVTVEREIVTVPKLKVTEPKSEAGKREVGIDAATISVLRAHRKAQVEHRVRIGAAWTDTGHVFTGVGGRHLHPDSITKAFDRQVRSLGMRRIRLHDLRHTHATLLLDAGEAVHVVAARLGHADPAVTLRVYAHSSRKQQAQAALRWANVIGQSQPGRPS